MTRFLAGSIVMLLSAAFAVTQAQEAPAAATKRTDAEPAVQVDRTPVQRPRTGATDRIDLDTTVVTGNRELPKVLYIVPWKKAELGDLPAQPFNTLLDEVLTPVDRDVFRREVTYYGAVAGSESKPAASDTASGTPARTQ